MFFILTMYAAVALAQWGNSATESLWVNTADEYYYSFDVQQAHNGNTWFYMDYAPDAHCVQLYDSTGVALLGDKWMLVSNYPDRITGYVNNNLFVDREGNAIVVVSDLRHAPANTDWGTYTAYKISQTGEMLWGEDGISIDGGNGTHINACMGITQLSDDSYVFTWTHCDDDEVLFSIDVQRVSVGGELLWDAAETRLTDTEGKVTYFWPYVVDAGMGQCILVYTRGSNNDLYARKLDFDGTPVWSKDVRIYRGGFLNTPLWGVLYVEPSGDGGVIVTWYDDRYNTGIESIYMSYVKPNGELAFSEGEEGLRLTYSGYRALSTTCTYDSHSDSFIAFWREATPGQGNYRVVAQSVSKEGELLWGEEGLVVEDFGEYVSYGDLCLQSAHDGEIAAFYMRRNQLDYGNVDVCMQIIDTRTGAFRWEESPILTSTQQPTEKNEIQVTDMLPNGSWIFCWDDRGVESNPDYKRLYINRANYDGSVGNPDDAAVTTTHAARGTSFTFASQVDGKRAFTIYAAESTSATLTIYNVDGTYMAMPFSGRLQAGKQYVEWNAYIPAGIYLATLTTTYGVETIKILVK